MISPRLGRFLSATGAILLVAGLFATWYTITRQAGTLETASGFETFPRLRVAIIAGALLLLASAVVPQSRPVLAARAVVGLGVGLLILRRIVFPPDLADPVSAEIGVFVGLIGALAAAAGGIVDAGREVIERYPEMPFRRSAGELGAGPDAGRPQPLRSPRRPVSGGTVDSTAEEI